MVRVVEVVKVVGLITVVEVVRKLNVPTKRTRNPTSRPCRKRLVTISTRIITKTSVNSRTSPATLLVTSVHTECILFQ